MTELCNDAFVSAFEPTGRRLRYSTYLGGAAEDQGLGIAVSAAGQAHVTGRTDSRDFPTAHAVQPRFGGYIDAFAATLAASGRALAASTHLGGSGSERGNAITLDAVGNPYVAGRTDSMDFPTSNAVQRGRGGDFAGFVLELRGG